MDSKRFSLNKSGSVLTFSNSSSVKSWSQQFVDIADKVVVEVVASTTNLTANDVLVAAKWKERNSILSSLTYSVPACPGEQYPTPEQPYCGNY
ncbi:hypothetical protein [Thalassotalea fusca]